MGAPFHYRWTWRLQSPPDAIWPLVSDTSRFNRDTGVPPVERRSDAPSTGGGWRRHLRLERVGVAVEWEEEPFEWVRPIRFGVVRRYVRGPIAALRVLVELIAIDGGGTDLVYQVWAEPKGWLGYLAIPIQIGLLSARRFERTIRRYDREAARRILPVALPSRVRFAEGGRERLAVLRDAVVAEGADATLATRLVAAVEQADDSVLAEVRPYVLADAWGVSRQRVLELCLLATRAGLLEFRWKVLCPLCRGSQNTSTTLRDVASNVHCESCHIDFRANFERSVELTFRPVASVREIEVREFCVGGPQVTPHIVAQQLLPAGTARDVQVALESGRYRLRTMTMPGSQSLYAGNDGAQDVQLRAGGDAWPDEELRVSMSPLLHLENATAGEELFILERMAWTDQAATAAEVIALQTFRDLFASEALRPGEEFSVGSLAIVFTDLRQSTDLYRKIGDAVAFGWVRDHFDVVKEAIAAEGGAVVKTIGDAVMAVFRRPLSALRAMLRVQCALASPSRGEQALRLKVGLHYGPCIAVTLNERLDYFGSTINIAARLEGQSSGQDVVISSTVRDDPEVSQWISAQQSLRVERIETALKGFDDRRFELWRVSA